MNVNELNLPDRAIDALINKGFVTLHPPQAEAVPLALDKHNLVVAVPTASGKSLIGYIAALRTILVDKRRVLYIVPLKALASEKKDDLEEFSDLGFSVAMSTGDLDSEERWLSNADVIVATSEKADSLIRHGSTWMNDVGLVIADEIHLIHDPSRGPTLEVALTKMMRRNHDMQIIALSATISNSKEVAEWLKADLVTSEWRPIPLKEGVFFDGTLTFKDRKTTEISIQKDEIWSLIKDTVTNGGQCLVFVNARRSTESLAVKYCKEMEKISGHSSLDEHDLAILEGESETTALGKKLASCVKAGMAFHNAGLTSQQRKFVENSFRKGDIKCIVATPTLAAGINLPARRVIVRDTKRFDANAGYTPISVMEIKQMCGRAGRPKYDSYGEAVLIAKNPGDVDHLIEDYLSGESESVISKLGNESVLRSHILGLIATEDVSSESEIVEFLKSTFFGHQSQLIGADKVVENVVSHLISEGMVERDKILKTTPFGKRVSDLYIDPESAVILRNAIMKLKDDTPDISIMHAVASTPDVPGLYPRKADVERLEITLNTLRTKLLVEEPDEYDLYDYFLGALKVAELLVDWMSESDEESMTDKMGVGPGDIRAKVDTAEWLLHSMVEIAIIFRPDIVRMLRPLLTRVRYGIRDELMELVSFKGVGRSRARTLFSNGIKTRADVADIDLDMLASLPRIGNSLAKSLKEQVGTVNEPKRHAPEPYVEFRDEPEPTEINEKVEKKRQQNLFDY